MNNEAKFWMKMAKLFGAPGKASSGGAVPAGKFYSLGDNNEIEQVVTGRNFICPPFSNQRTQEQIAQMAAKPKAKYPDWVQCIAGAICGASMAVICGWAWIYFHGC